eukprot:9490599-Pyramimonas_sp.AAC.1
MPRMLNVSWTPVSPCVGWAMWSVSSAHVKQQLQTPALGQAAGFLFAEPPACPTPHLPLCRARASL